MVCEETESMMIPLYTRLSQSLPRFILRSTYKSRTLKKVIKFSTVSHLRVTEAV